MNTPTKASVNLPERAQQVLRAHGNLIEAIKIVREEEGLGLKEAKDKVEAWIASQPELKQQLDARSREARGGFWVLGLVLLAGIAAAISFFKA